MKTVLRYYRPYIPFIVLILVFLFGQAMCELALPGYMSDIINYGIVGQDMDYIKHTGAIMIAVSAATLACLSLIHIYFKMFSKPIAIYIDRHSFINMVNFCIGL